MFQLDQLKLKILTVDENFMITELIKSNYHLQINFVTEKEFLLEGFRVEVTPFSI